MLGESLETGYVGGIGSDGCAGQILENAIVKVIFEFAVFFAVSQVGGQQGDAPGAAFRGGSHDGHRSVDCCSKHLLHYQRCFEQAAVAHDPVELYAFLLEQDVHAQLYCAQGSIEIYAHEVSKVESAVRGADIEGTSFVDEGDVFSGVIAVSQKAAAVRIAGEGVGIEFAEEGTHIRLNSHQITEFLEHAHQGVEVGGAVVGMGHGHREAGGSGHHVDLAVQFGELTLQDHHGKGAGAGREAGSRA